MKGFLPAEEIMEQYRKRRFRQWILAAVLLVPAILLVLLQKASHLLPATIQRYRDPILGAVGVEIAVAIIAGLIFTYFNWRCPSCEKYLGRSLSLRFCPRCGAKFVADDV